MFPSQRVLSTCVINLRNALLGHPWYSSTSLQPFNLRYPEIVLPEGLLCKGLWRYLCGWVSLIPWEMLWLVPNHIDSETQTNQNMFKQTFANKKKSKDWSWRCLEGTSPLPQTNLSAAHEICPAGSSLQFAVRLGLILILTEHTCVYSPHRLNSKNIRFP